jgi:hypothetical protein
LGRIHSEGVSFNLFICDSEFKTFENNSCELTTELKKDSFGIQKLFQLIVSLIPESDMIQAFGTFQCFDIGLLFLGQSPDD